MSSRRANIVHAEYERSREELNPLRGLTISRAVSLLETMYSGAMADLQWTYRFIEESDPDLLALVELRTSALDEMDYTIKVVSEEKHPRTWDERLAEDQRARLGEAYERIDNVYEAIGHMGMATFRKYAHLQMHLDAAEGMPAHLEPLDQWNWVRKGTQGPWYWNPSARQLNWESLGEPMDPRRDLLVIREVARHVNRFGLVKFIRSNLSEKDWDGFIDLYGIPKWLIIGPEGMDEDKAKEWQRAAQDLAGGGFLPHGASAEAVTPERSGHPFQPRLDHLQKQLILAGTSGQLTMLTASGSGTLAGGAHMATFRTLARAEARRISEVFQQGVDRYVLDRAFPDKPHLAYFTMVANEEQDIGELVEHALKLSQAGARIDLEQLGEKTGYRLSPAPETPVVAGAAQHRCSVRAAHRDPLLEAAGTGDRAAAVDALGERVDAKLQAAGRDALARAVADDLAPLRERIRAALEHDDDAAMLAALAEIPADLPAMLLDIGRGPRAEAVLEETLTAALLNGFVEGAAARGPLPSPESPEETLL